MNNSGQCVLLCNVLILLSRKHIKADHQRPTRETPFECRFADGPMVALDAMLARYLL